MIFGPEWIIELQRWWIDNGRLTVDLILWLYGSGDPVESGRMASRRASEIE